MVFIPYLSYSLIQPLGKYLSIPLSIAAALRPYLLKPALNNGLRGSLCLLSLVIDNQGCLPALIRFHHDPGIVVQPKIVHPVPADDSQVLRSHHGQVAGLFKLSQQISRNLPNGCRIQYPVIIEIIGKSPGYG